MKINTKEMILIALFAALTAVGAFIRIPLGTVPITLQLLFTVLAGIILGGKLGALSQLVYMVLGLLGLPVFAGGTGGITAIFSPSFGYVMGFILGAFVIGRLCELYRSPSVLKLFFISIIGVIVIYAIGVPYLYFSMNNLVGKAMTFSNALKFGLFVFIPGDLLKCIAAAVLGVRVVSVKRKVAV